MEYLPSLLCKVPTCAQGIPVRTRKEVYGVNQQPGGTEYIG